ncbi:MAG: hypothetical protein OXF79_20895 [Chloroflexi bacterium]|nr:hypothetical protein [Chloroflexota bacterium]
MNATTQPAGAIWPAAPTLFVEAFGHLRTPFDTSRLIDAEDEDLYSVFRTRSELMSWYGADRTTRRPLAWGMHEAEITANADNSGPDATRVAYVQVGMASSHPADVALRLPALIQCFHDAVDRFGDIELSAIQVTVDSIAPSPSSCLSDLISPTNWFNTVTKGQIDAIITFDQGSLGDAETRRFARLQRGVNAPFAFGPLAKAPAEHCIAESDEMFNSFRDSLQPADVGLPVTLSEWTPSAIGWVLAVVVDCICTHAVDSQEIIIRITRID